MNILETSKKVQEKVKAAIENMTGLEVADVNIHIASVDMENEKKASKRKKESKPFLFFSMNVCVSWHFFCRDFRELQIVGGNMRRREQREHIFKLLFISEFNTQKEMEEQLALYLADIENLEESDRDYISRKYMNIMNHTDELDEKLNSISMGWKTSRMNRVDLTVLRLAVYELEYEKEEVPVGVAINEAVELAKCFGSEESGAFVNGILERLPTRIRRLLQERHLLRKKNRPLQDRNPVSR